MTTKRELQLRERIAKNKEKISKDENALKAILRLEARAREKERNSRLYNKAANEEALFAMDQMDALTHLEFLKELTQINQAAQLILEYHLKTRGMQYGSVEDFRNYVAVKYRECFEMTKNAMEKADKRKAQAREIKG